MSNIRIVIENENNLKQITNFSRKKKRYIYKRNSIHNLQQHFLSPLCFPVLLDFYCDTSTSTLSPTSLPSANLTVFFSFPVYYYRYGSSCLGKPSYSSPVSLKVQHQVYPGTCVTSQQAREGDKLNDKSVYLSGRWVEPENISMSIPFCFRKHFSVRCDLASRCIL